MFRTIFALTFTMVWSAVWISAVILALPFIRDPEFTCFLARRYWGPGLMWGGGQGFEVRGQENCPAQPCVYLANHQGIPDICMLYVAIPRAIRFVAKKALMYVPFLGWYMLLDKHIFIDRRNRSEAFRSLQQAGKRIREGISVIMYPEGTRTLDGQILPFKKGPFRLALEAQVPIVPVALEGSRNCWPKGSLWITAGVLRVNIGKPIPTAGLQQDDRDDLMRRVRGAMIELHKEIGGAGGNVDDNIAPDGRLGPSAVAQEHM